MRKIKQLFVTLMAFSLMLTFSVSIVKATDGLEVTLIVANTYVGDGQREVSSFEITVNDIDLVNNLVAEDFDIVNNVGTIPFDVNTGELVTAYEDDEITLSLQDNTIIMNVKAFNYNGDYNNNQWQVNCEKYPELSFNKEDVTTLNTRTLDDAIRGSYTYAGITREYALYLPANSDGSYKTDVPLVIWNHGGGEYAGDIENTLVANRGLTSWVEAGYDCAVLEFQISNENYSYGASFDESKKALIDRNNALQAAFAKQLISDGWVDENRVYVTGASSGGGATMRFVMQYPELFAGAIACCSMDPIVWVHFNNQDSYETIVENFETAFQGYVYTWDETSKQMVTKNIDTDALINLPIYFTHAQNDTTCSVNSSKAMYEALNNLGAQNNHLTIWSDAEMAEDGLPAGPLLHWSWVKIFNHNEEGTPMNWLFKQVKMTTVPKEDEVKEPVQSENVVTTTDNKTTAVKTGDDSSLELLAGMAGITLLTGYCLMKKKYC
ncbi:prolyl oligopeptidase family serine peptidase [Thomasclavelia sp.]|uniref:carboxylesterase family protein n=1 Tax=Thomasclavelia sp. TaxID=3025757 RepID=UPI0025F31736|nr:prolyl oligopeptidase family serine peptidase [Thomasclavelia sp.]